MTYKNEKNYTFKIGMESAYADGGAAATFLPVFVDGRPEFVPEKHEQPLYQGSLARTKFITGKGTYAATAKFYLKGSSNFGSAAPEIGKLLRIAGLQESITQGPDQAEYNPRDTGQESATIDINLDGILYKIKGARVESLSIPLTAGAPVLMEAKIRGVYTAPSGSVLVSPTFGDAAIAVQIVQSMALTVGGTAYVIPSMSLQLQNRIVVVESITSPYRGIQEVAIAERQWGGQMRVAVDSNNSISYWTTLTGNSELAIATTTGFGTGHKIASSNIQFEDVKPVADNGLNYYDITFRINKASSLANELSLIIV